MINLGKTMDLILEKCKKLKLDDIEEFFRSISEGWDRMDLDDVEGTFGGSFYLIENESDLEKVPTATYNVTSGRYYNIKEISDIFDDVTHTLGHYCFFNATNNGGGDTYIIPKNIAEKYPTIIESARK